MISPASQDSEEHPDVTPPHADDYIAPAPRVSVQAFCTSDATATAARGASEDRRLAKAHLSVHMGGIEAAIETYHKAPTPNVIILETERDHDILAGLDELATVCAPGTRVVVIGSASGLAASTTTSSGRSKSLMWCARSAACSRRPRPSRSAGWSPSLAQKAVSARP